MVEVIAWGVLTCAGVAWAVLALCSLLGLQHSWRNAAVAFALSLVVCGWLVFVAVRAVARG